MSDPAATQASLSSSQPAFLADAMLERLARWLRVLGYDVESANLAGSETETLLTRAASQGRIILTRNHRFAAPGPAGDAVLVEPSAPLEQLSQLIARLGLSEPWRLFTRCLICNGALGPAQDRAPIGVTQPPEGAVVRQCSRCGRQYWEGVHARRMRSALRRSLGPGFVEILD